MKYVASIAYDGSHYYGFQRLNDLCTVQKEVEEALTKINKSEVSVKGAGRTDRGVHANDQKVAFCLEQNIPEDGLKEAMNSLLKPYTYVKNVKVVNDLFHPRHDVVKKRYVYKINMGEFNPLYTNYICQCEYPLNVDKMKEVAKLYLGVHDFHNFVSGERADYTCVIYDIRFKMKDEILNIEFEGKSFYRYMVRNLVGAMIEVGRGKIDIDHVALMLDSEGDLTTYTAPAEGLYLDKIWYKEDI